MFVDNTFANPTVPAYPTAPSPNPTAPTPSPTAPSAVFPTPSAPFPTVSAPFLTVSAPFPKPVPKPSAALVTNCLVLLGPWSLSFISCCSADRSKTPFKLSIIKPRPCNCVVKFLIELIGSTSLFP